MKQESFETIYIVGLGGLPTAAVSASRKVRVIGVDANQHAEDRINRGQIHIFEPNLEMVEQATVSEGYLRAKTRPKPDVANCLMAHPDQTERDVSNACLGWHTNLTLMTAGKSDIKSRSGSPKDTFRKNTEHKTELT